jgi:glycosyltransferase involved in cell wall biosynthesis
MHRICGSLAKAGYAVTLTGRRLKNSMPLQQQPWTQRRLRCWFNSGKLFYAEYNLRLFFYLLFKKTDAICAIDLDTILPGNLVARIRRKKKIYDAHELFTELKEVITRPRIHASWLRIEKRMVPRFQYGYTVSDGIAAVFKQRYDVQYETIRNMPLLEERVNKTVREKFILYQGAVNEGRCFESLIPAMHHIDCRLVICGDGNFMPQLKELIAINKLEDKIELKGMMPPATLKEISSRATIGISLAEKEGLNQWLALPNKFFDYIHAGLPQITMNYPEYKKLNEQFDIAVLLDDTAPEKVAAAVNKLLTDTVMYARLAENCMKTRLILNWQEEEKKLLAFYKNVFSN